jgi:AraC family transcriptional regulator of adaptative response / DNA-3-methyladenine glycosylase II
VGQTDDVLPDFDTCYRALAGRDARFDGVFFTGVRTTGIYCRPICPAQQPKPANVHFYASAAAAVAAGFRACRRCRPDAVPGSRQWDARGDLAARALRLIAAGALDDGGVGAVAGALHVSERHLHRVLVAEVGAGPLALARTRRAQTARLLLDETDLTVTDVAFAAGFASVRQFNDTMRAEFGATPTELRRSRRRAPRPEAAPGSLTLRLRHRDPYDAEGVLDHLRARAVPGLESVDGDTWTRALRTPRGATAVSVTPRAGHVVVTLAPDHLEDLPMLVAAVRRSWDLDADPAAIEPVLAADPALAPLIVARPGTRIFTHADGFEAAVRAVLGQRISVASARSSVARLVAQHGAAVDGSGSELRAFPAPESMVDVELPGLPARLSATIREIATRVADGRLVVDASADRDEFRTRMLEIPGVGPWTVEYTALRGLADPDAFPATDLVLAREVTARGADPARWRPWRAYGAMHLWNAAPAAATKRTKKREAA